MRRMNLMNNKKHQQNMGKGNCMPTPINHRHPAAKQYKPTLANAKAGLPVHLYNRQPKPCALEHQVAKMPPVTFF